MSDRASGRDQPSRLLPIQEGAVRIAPLLRVPRLLASHGLDADATIAATGLDPALFADPDNSITFAQAGRLLAQAAAVTGCREIGLELCGEHGLEVLGAVGRASRFAPDLDTALRTLILHLHLHDRGAVPALWQHGSTALFGYSIHCQDVPGTEYIYDCALAVMHNIIRELVGAAWRPGEVHFFRSAPDDTSPYRRTFGVPLHFGSPQAAVVFPAADLARPVLQADDRCYAAALRMLATAGSCGALPLADQVRQLLRRLLVSGAIHDLDLAGIARLFSLHPRTLNRRLSAEGTTFAALLGETRYAVARQLLRDTALTPTDIAQALGYSDAAAFAHAFRRWSGTTASAWRARHAAA